MRVHLADVGCLEMSPYNGVTHVRDARAGVVVCEPERRKVAIVGAGHGREYAPYDDPEWEVWALNAIAPRDRFGRVRADRWFEMHIMAVQSEKDLTWIERCPFPLYLVPEAAEQAIAGTLRVVALDAADRVQAREVRVAQPVRYPLDAVEKAFPGGPFACSFAYQLALALLSGFEHVGLYGVELAYGVPRERTVEWACVSWWLGLATGLGVQVHLPGTSLGRLGRHRYRYGIEYHEEKRDVEQYLRMMVEIDAERAREDREAEGMGG